MKKLLLICLIFAVVMPVCLTAFAGGSSIQPIDAKLTINGTEVTAFESGYAVVEVSFKNNGTSDETVTVVIAEYTEKNGFITLSDSACDFKTIPAGKTGTLFPGLKITSDTSMVRLFAYDSAKLQPVAVYKFNNTGSNPEIDKTYVTGLESPSVCTWADNKTAAVSIVIDDGVYESAPIYNELLKKYNIHSTQFMITSKLYNEDGSVNTQLVSDWQNIFDDGYMDLGNHSYSHKIRYNQVNTYTQQQLEEDISGSYEKLCTLFPTQDIIAFASPWSQWPDNAYKEALKNHYAARGKFMGTGRYAVTYGTELATLNAKVNDAITNGNWYVELLHGIGSKGTASGDYSSNKTTIENHFSYISEKSTEGKVWAGSYNEVVKYVYERDSAKSEILWATNSSMGISLTDDMDDEIFDYPLTIKVNLPLTWKDSVNVKQNGNTESFKIFTEGEKNYAYINVIPDSGSAVVTPE